MLIFQNVLDGARDEGRMLYVHVHRRASPRNADCASSSLMVLWVCAGVFTNADEQVERYCV